MVATPVDERPWEPTGPRGEICWTTRGRGAKKIRDAVISSAGSRRPSARAGRPPLFAGTDEKRDPGWQKPLTRHAGVAGRRTPARATSSTARARERLVRVRSIST